MGTPTPFREVTPPTREVTPPTGPTRESRPHRCTGGICTYRWGGRITVGMWHHGWGCGVHPNPDPTQPETSTASEPSICGVSRRLMRPPTRWGLPGFHFRPKTGCFSDPGSPHRIIATAWTDGGQPPAPNPDLGGDRPGEDKVTPQRLRGTPSWVLARMIRKEHPPEHTRSPIPTLRLPRLDRVCPECC